MVGLAALVGPHPGRVDGAVALGPVDAAEHELAGSVEVVGAEVDAEDAVRDEPAVGELLHRRGVVAALWVEAQRAEAKDAGLRAGLAAAAELAQAADGDGLGDAAVRPAEAERLVDEGAGAAVDDVVKVVVVDPDGRGRGGVVVGPVVFAGALPACTAVYAGVLVSLNLDCNCACGV